MPIICIGYTEARAGAVRSALLQEVALLAPTAAVYVTLLDPRVADAHEATFSSPIGYWKGAAELEDVVSGVVPERR